MQIPDKLPTHVSIIMDGNGRWAKERGKERVYGHFEGVESVRAVIEAGVEWKIPYISFFAFSEENWGRPDAEVQTLMELMGRAMLAELDNFMEHDVRFMVLGNRARLSDALKADIDKVMGATAANKGLTMILFLSYSGRWDILQAAEKMAHDLIEHPGRPVQPEDFSRYLVTAGIPDPDLLIRTSALADGIHRICIYRHALARLPQGSLPGGLANLRFTGPAFRKNQIIGYICTFIE